jgi:sugar phosphate isomerase/epimerase
MAKMAAEIGFDGVDLTVRSKGHVLPERVSQDLPKAIEAMDKAGIAPLMIASGVNDPSDPVQQNVLKTAADLGIKYYRMAYFRYTKDGSIPKDVETFQEQAKALGELNDQLGLIGCYQNHAGNYVGASMFELYEIFKGANEQSTGLQYDIRHATVEGGRSWETGLRLVQDRIKTIALKDFRWEQRSGKWETVNVPMGEGMVDFKTYFGLLKRYGIKVPATLHLEYPIGGAEHGARELEGSPDQVYNAMRKDLEFVSRMWASS